MSLRDLVRERAGMRFEYCRIPEEFDLLPFQLDHILAQKHYGPTNLDNLPGVAAIATQEKDLILQAGTA